jgi:hypothetical protein
MSHSISWIGATIEGMSVMVHSKTQRSCSYPIGKSYLVILDVGAAEVKASPDRG